MNAIEMIARCMTFQNPTLDLPPAIYGHDNFQSQGQVIPEETFVPEHHPIEPTYHPFA